MKKGPVNTDKTMSIHREAPAFEEQDTTLHKFLKPELKLLT